MMLNEGKGGFTDFYKYRELLVDIFWNGNIPEQTDEQKAEAAREAIGTPTPVSAMAEARALYERAKERSRQAEAEIV